MNEGLSIEELIELKAFIVIVMKYREQWPNGMREELEKLMIDSP